MHSTVLALHVLGVTVLAANFVPRHARQKEEGELWVANAVAYMLEIKLYSPTEKDQAIDLAENLLYRNRNEGGEIMDWDVQAVIDEELTYWGD